MDISGPPRRPARILVVHLTPDRARLIAELTARNPGIAELLMDLESDDDVRAKLEIELLR